MNKLRKLFLQTNVTWPFVIILSLICGVVTGLVMIPEFLKGTSFQQPGISFEFWIFVALFIILNCKKPFEAGVKIFVFFLISQPLIYLVQVPFVQQGWGIFSYYKLWGIITVLTFPSAMLAFLVKKGNLFSVLILSIANGILCYELPSFVYSVQKNFPRMIIAVLFIIAQIIFFILLLFKGKKEKIIAFIIALLMIIIFSFSFVKSTFNFTKGGDYRVKLKGQPPFKVVSQYDDYIITVHDDTLSVYCKMKYDSEIPIDIVDSDGKKQTIEFSYNNGSGEFIEVK